MKVTALNPEQAAPYWIHNYHNLIWIVSKYLNMLNIQSQNQAYKFFFLYVLIQNKKRKLEKMCKEKSICALKLHLVKAVNYLNKSYFTEKKYNMKTIEF